MPSGYLLVSDPFWSRRFRQQGLARRQPVTAVVKVGSHVTSAGRAGCCTWVGGEAVGASPCLPQSQPVGRRLQTPPSGQALPPQDTPAPGSGSEFSQGWVCFSGQAVLGHLSPLPTSWSPMSRGTGGTGAGGGGDSRPSQPFLEQAEDSACPSKPPADDGLGGRPERAPPWAQLGVCAAWNGPSSPTPCPTHFRRPTWGTGTLGGGQDSCPEAARVPGAHGRFEVGPEPAWCRARDGAT